jgi:hypothetical protein
MGDMVETIFILATRASPFGSRRQGRPKYLKPGVLNYSHFANTFEGSPIKGQYFNFQRVQNGSASPSVESCPSGAQSYLVLIQRGRMRSRGDRYHPCAVLARADEQSGPAPRAPLRLATPHPDPP